MTKVLNLDNLADAARELVIKGKSYPVKGMTVQAFIAITQAAEKLTDESTFAEQIGATVDTIILNVPTIGREVLLDLSLDQLRAVMEFVRGEVPAGATEVEATETGKATKKK